VEVKAKLIVGERPEEPTLYYQYLIGFAYLAIGLFVYSAATRLRKPSISTCCV